MRTTPEWLVERLAAGELPEAKVRELRESGVDAQLQQIAQSNAELLAQHPPAEVMRELQLRLAVRAGRASARPVWLGAAAAAACGALLFLVVRNDAAPSGGIRTTEQVVPRGLEPHLVVFRKTASGAERLSSSHPVHAGDMLQLAYVSAGRKYGVVASIDGRGAITLHLPEQADTAARLSERNQSTLPHAFELDNTPGVERFVFVSADEPFATQVVVEALRTGAPLQSHFARHEIALEKQP